MCFKGEIAQSVSPLNVSSSGLNRNDSGDRGAYSINEFIH